MVNELLKEDQFKSHNFTKNESNYALGNGYLGIRSTNEEDYFGQVRGMYISGFYNKGLPNEVNELVNCPDIIACKIKINDELFDLKTGCINDYSKTLNLKTGLLTRTINWTSPLGIKILIEFKRFVSQANKYLIVQDISIKSSHKIKVSIETGIDGQMTNSGITHLIENNMFLKDEWLYAQFQSTSLLQKINYHVKLSGSYTSKVAFAKKRQLTYLVQQEIDSNEKFYLCKKSIIDNDNYKHDLKIIAQSNFNDLFAQSNKVWTEHWLNNEITLKSDNDIDELSLNFALYHLKIMVDDNAQNHSIGAKALSGEGYKGHVFWDTEIFLLPYYNLFNPRIAQKLLMYRFNRLEEAKQKAQTNGYNGSLFPWESASTGQEETPELAALNIKTGTRQEVASAKAEHHIVCDISYALLQYYYTSNDVAFLIEYGMKILQENALFWLSRATLEADNKYHINNIIGPDEYTEFIDDNSYTNYLVSYTIKNYLILAIKFKIEYDKELDNFINNLYLPKVNNEMVLPQDKTFFTKPIIDVSRYAKKAGQQTILLDYTRDEVINMQVLKQADVIMLHYLLPDLFNDTIKLNNYEYYEPKTIHDSSLSKAIYSIVAARLNKIDEAYDMYQDACLIDLGSKEDVKSEGIHAASIGAIVSNIISGFIDLHINEKGIYLNPHLPKAWKQLSFKFNYQNNLIQLDIEKDNICIKTNQNNLNIYLNNNKIQPNKKYQLKECQNA